MALEIKEGYRLKEETVLKEETPLKPGLAGLFLLVLFLLRNVWPSG